jgi:hypothetical protein
LTCFTANIAVPVSPKCGNSFWSRPKAVKFQKRIVTSGILPALLKRARRREATACGRVAQFDCGSIPGLENGRLGAHIPGMATIVQCDCGA